MRLTIDTSTDSKDDLRRVIRFLQLFVNEHDFRNDLRKFEDETTPAAPTALGDFFTSLDQAKGEDKKTPPSNDFKLDFF